MGIPAFYRWLVEKYPRTVVEAVEEPPEVVGGVAVPIDTTKNNPNGVEYDNLYLDMNGIIHPCFHPEGLPAPKTNDEVFNAVFKYIDRLFSIIRPRKLLFLAIDGVAPRAKMNQQRARRFRAAKELADEVSATERLQSVYEKEPEGLDDKKLDSNVITPGTEFMELLSAALKYYIHLRMNKDPGWQGVKVILSDASVPGEGEHKIVSYIRLQRNLPGYDPNTRHCLYGLDADLIMLALATHEIHFTILREDVRRAPANDRNQKHGKKPKGGAKHRKNGSEQSERGGGFIDLFDIFLSSQKFQILRIWVLREYLAHELQIQNPMVKGDLERLIDDFVFMCLFVGNDFLPHVPSLEIPEGAIDLLMTVYKKEFVQMGGHLTNSFEVNLERLEHFLKAVGSHEGSIFKKRNQIKKEWETRAPRSSAKSNLRETQAITNHVEVNSAVDKVQLGEEGWKERYYMEKFEVQTDDERNRIQKHAVSGYVEGICWVMHYYYQGICSWQWFYPYHYAPFASDFQGLDQLEISFTLGNPFKPFDQLMGVLPAASAQALPIFYRNLMKDPSSPILDFYPTDFEVDLNGKKHVWQGVCKLPFIEEARLLAEITKVEHTLTDEEKQRNSLGLDVLFIYKSHPLAPRIRSFWKRNKDNSKLLKAKVKRKINPKFSGGMNGYIYISDKPVCAAEIASPTDDMKMIVKNKVISVFYKVPTFHPHIPKLPKGVIMPRKLIRQHHIRPPAIMWHENTALVRSRYSSRPMPQKSLSGPCLATLAHQLVSNCVAKSQTRVSPSECGKRNRDDADEQTKKKKRRNKKRKPDLIVLETCVAKSQAGEDQFENGKTKSDDADERPCLAGSARPLVSETCIVKSLASENQCENGKRKRDDADEHTKKSKKKRNKKRKMDLIVLETCVAKSQANEDQHGSGNSKRENADKAPGLAKLAHQLVSETNVAKSQAGEDQCQNGSTEKEVTDKSPCLTELSHQLASQTCVAKSQASENQCENGRTEREDADERPGGAELAHQLVSENCIAKSQAASENQCQDGETKRDDTGGQTTKRKKRQNNRRKMVGVVSETLVAKSQAREDQCESGNRKRDDAYTAKLIHQLESETCVAKSQSVEDQCEN